MAIFASAAVSSHLVEDAGAAGRGTAFSLLFLLAVMIPMICYVARTNRTSREAM